MPRLGEVDLLRGAVMLLMLVDHAREYSAGTGQVTDPMDVAAIDPLLFALRWITHLCAPVFVLLAGASARFQARRLDAPELARHLAIRGLVLIALEFTLVAWGWTFWPGWERKWAQVIWGIGLSMIALAALIRVRAPEWCIAGLGVLLVAGHNLLDGVRVDGLGPLRYLWAVLHQREVLPLWPGAEIRTSYPVMPMIGVICLGWWFGRRLLDGADRRWLAKTGMALLALFAALRMLNVYGDPHRWSAQPETWRTIASFINVTKYPMSLDFVLLMLGTGLLMLAALRGARGAWTGPLALVGRVPMFYYLLHIYALHLLALLWAALRGFPWAAFDFRARLGGIPEGFGFPLWVTLPFAAVTLLAIWPACRWYDEVRRAKRWGWTRWL